MIVRKVVRGILGDPVLSVRNRGTLGFGRSREVCRGAKQWSSTSGYPTGDVFGGGLVDPSTEKSLESHGKPHVQSTHASFYGHVKVEGNITMILDPRVKDQTTDKHGIFLEVKTRDVGLKEQLPTVVTENGESIACFRVWVRKGSVVKKVQPFTV
mmetsp:Transcript_8218/g.13281  ORF Transcript_8218/g.13281 Transcript_8218/m.13281 type:complete len:155 (-) Transcript_8218:1508-1972(-)